MVSYAPATHPVVVATTANPKDDLTIDGRIALLKQLQASGVADVQFGNSAPGDNTKLWWHTSANAAKRYNPLTGAWVALTESQFALWMHRRLVAAAGTETVFEASDLFPFHDASAGEAKVINGENLRAGLRGGWQQHGATITLAEPASFVNFADLPARWNSFAVTADYSTTGGGATKYDPRLRGVYPTNALVDLSAGLSGTTLATGQRRVLQFSGDAGDQTGFTFRDFRSVNDAINANESDSIIPLTNRLVKVRYAVPDGTVGAEAMDTWQFATGSTFKLFVR